MTKTAFNRDGVLTSEERAASARKCVNLLGAVDPHSMREKDWTFFCDQLAESKKFQYAPSERQLAWLRDLVEKYAQ